MNLRYSSTSSRRRLALQQGDGVTQVLQPVLLELFGGVRVVVVTLGFCRHDVVEKLAVAVLLAGFDIGLGHGDRLAKGTPALGGHHDHSRAGRRFEDQLPFLGCEVCLRCHHRSPIAPTASSVRWHAP